MSPDWIKFWVAIGAAVVSAYVTFEVRHARMKTQMEEREKQRVLEMSFVNRRLNMLNQEVKRVRDAYHDLRKKTIEAWAYARQRQGKDLDD